MQTIKYDLIICGGGLAGLSLVYRGMKSGLWANEQILVLDKSAKDQNDKTWSFWKTGPVDFENIIYRSWNKFFFFSNEGKKIVLANKGYTYNSIRSIDFYKYVLSYLRQFSNITFIKEEVLSMASSDGECSLLTTEHTYTAKYLFNSLYRKPELAADTQYFLQHFKGWKIRTTSVIPPVSDAYLMDFRTDQVHGTTFFYTLPMADDEIFIEYTLFTKSLLAPEQYDCQIKAYLNDVLKISSYEILETEFGAIPMTDHKFKRFEGNIVHLGTAGGDTRASTGYTFTNTQKTIKKILDSYHLNGHPFFKHENISVKHQLYDTTLLNVLAKNKYQGHQLFSDLFSKSNAYHIFSFLDAETTVFQDLQIMKSLKVMPFLRSFTIALFRKLRLPHTVK